MSGVKEMPDPILRNWRQVLKILVGQVTGHPTVKDGWMTTSIVVEMSPARDWARTQSRLYRLADPLPEHEPIPPGGQDALLTRMFRNSGEISMEHADRIVEFVAQLSAPSSHG